MRVIQAREEVTTLVANEANEPNRFEVPSFWSAMKRPKLKVCGIGSADAAYAAWQLGIDAVGIHALEASGLSSIEISAEWCSALPQGLAKFVLLEIHNIDALLKVRHFASFDTVQIQRFVQPNHVREISQVLRSHGFYVVKSVGVTELGIDRSIEYIKEISSFVDGIVLDTMFVGGQGIAHDWRLARGVRDAVSIPVLLAGGLNSDNLIEAIEAVRPWAIDVRSGSEDRLSCANGRTIRVKSVTKINALVAAMRGAEFTG